MPKKTAIKFRVEDAPGTLVTYGEVWRLPHKSSGEKPVIEHLAVGTYRSTPKTLEPGWYAYYFSFSGHQDDDAFEFVMAYQSSSTPEPQRETYAVADGNSRVFRFLV